MSVSAACVCSCSTADSNMSLSFANFVVTTGQISFLEKFVSVRMWKKALMLAALTLTFPVIECNRKKGGEGFNVFSLFLSEIPTNFVLSYEFPRQILQYQKTV